VPLLLPAAQDEIGQAGLRVLPLVGRELKAGIARRGEQGAAMKAMRGRILHDGLPTLPPKGSSGTSGEIHIADAGVLLQQAFDANTLVVFKLLGKLGIAVIFEPVVMLLVLAIGIVDAGDEVGNGDEVLLAKGLPSRWIGTDEAGLLILPGQYLPKVVVLGTAIKPFGIIAGWPAGIESAYYEGSGQKIELAEVEIGLEFVGTGHV
jgi:hypothetical protein